MTSIDLLIAACSLAAVALMSFTLLTAWQGWLALKNRELELGHSGPGPDRNQGGIERGATREGAARIELADLRERIRKLEAIASGVDL